MKVGYSILLGETLDASFVEYGDCKALQIVCGNCKEPVFKVCRTRENGGNTDYLAHYDKRLAKHAECESRVAVRCSTEVLKSNAVAREQRLHYFLSVIETSVRRHPDFDAEGERFIRGVSRRPGYNALRSLLVKKIRSQHSRSTAEKLLRARLGELHKRGFAFETGLQLEIQVRIVLDLFEMLLRPIAHKTFRFLFDASFLKRYKFSYLCRGSGLVSEEDVDSFVETFDIILQARKREVPVLIRELRRPYAARDVGINDPDSPEISMIDVYTDDTLIAMLTLLMEQPYLSILTDQYGDARVEKQFIATIQVPDDLELRASL